MTRVVIVGDMFYSDLRPDQGLPGQPPGYWGGVAPPHPDQGLPGGQGGHPSHPIYHPGHPDHGLPSQPPGYWGGVAPPRPDQGLPGQPPGYWGGVAPPHPDQGLPPGGEEVPPDELPLPEPPEEYKDDIVVAVKKPGQEWEVRAYEIQPDQGQPQPTPQSQGSPPRPPRRR